VARRFVAIASRLLFKAFITPGIGDTQAGLKAFTRDAAKELFGQQKVDGFIFDVEILLLARRREYRITKAFVPWQDKPGSTIRLRRDSFRAVLDLVKIYWRLKSGKYDGSAE
jgi:dolichyl-phosphate beta-glucosyltransferase